MWERAERVREGKSRSVEVTILWKEAHWGQICRSEDEGSDDESSSQSRDTKIVEDAGHLQMPHVL